LLKRNKFKKEIIDFSSSESRIELYAILEKKKLNFYLKKIFQKYTICQALKIS